MTVVNSLVSLERTWEMSQVCNRANAITIYGFGALPSSALRLCTNCNPLSFPLATFSALSLRFPFLPFLSWFLVWLVADFFFLPNGGTVWENDSVQFALYFQSGFEAVGCEDKVLQCRGKLATLKYQQQNNISPAVSIQTVHSYLSPCCSANRRTVLYDMQVIQHASYHISFHS